MGGGRAAGVLIKRRGPKVNYLKERRSGEKKINKKYKTALEIFDTPSHEPHAWGGGYAILRPSRMASRLTRNDPGSLARAGGVK